MLSGYRSVILGALVCLVCVTFGLGYYHAALNYPKEQRYEPYRYATDKPEEADPALPRPTSAKPFEYRTPCYEPKGKDESDLCAQWRAAQAGEDSAFWAKWGFWIGVFGSSLLLWQIILTRKAVSDTGDATRAMVTANEIAQAALDSNTRPLLSIESVKINKLSPRYINDLLIFDFEGSAQIENLGHGPAFSVVCNCLLFYPEQMKDATDVREMPGRTSVPANKYLDLIATKENADFLGSFALPDIRDPYMLLGVTLNYEIRPKGPRRKTTRVFALLNRIITPFGTYDGSYTREDFQRGPINPIIQPWAILEMS